MIHILIQGIQKHGWAKGVTESREEINKTEVKVKVLGRSMEFSVYI